MVADAWSYKVLPLMGTLFHVALFQVLIVLLNLISSFAALCMPCDARIYPLVLARF